MKRTTVACCLVGLVAGAPDSFAAGQKGGQMAAPGPWIPAVVQGLRLGEATREAVLAQFDSPDRIESYSAEQTGGHPIEWWIYERPIDRRFPGRATVWIDGHTGRLTEITISPEGMSKEYLLSELGTNFQLTRYSFCEELGDGESAPIYEDPAGSLEHMEFRELGISVYFDWRGDVQDIHFLSEGFGIAKEKCLSAKPEVN